MAFASTPDAQEADGDGSTGQVLVAALPGKTPDVHIATLDAATRTLCLQEASIHGAGMGEVNLGGVTSIPLIEITDVERNGGALALLAGTRVLAELHLETPEEGAAWENALRSAVAAVNASPQGGGSDDEDADGQDSDAEVQLWRAQNQKLEERAHSLEASGRKRERQLKSLLRRLDGTMGMLSAVQDMVVQQRTVIGAQKVAIVELESERREQDKSTDREEARSSEQVTASCAAAACASSRHRLQEMVRSSQQEGLDRSRRGQEMVRGSQQERHRDWLQGLE